MEIDKEAEIKSVSYSHRGLFGHASVISEVNPKLWHYGGIGNDGKINKETADRLWNDFAYPPLVKVISK